MTDEQIKERFSSAKTLPDLIRISSELRKEGCNVLVVNKYMSEMRREIVSRVSSINIIKKQMVDVKTPTELVSSMYYDVQFLNKPYVLLVNPNTPQAMYII